MLVAVLAGCIGAAAIIIAAFASNKIASELFLFIILACAIIVLVIFGLRYLLGINRLLLELISQTLSFSLFTFLIFLNYPSRWVRPEHTATLSLCGVLAGFALGAVRYSSLKKHLEKGKLQWNLTNNVLYQIILLIAIFLLFYLIFTTKYGGMIIWSMACGVVSSTIYLLFAVALLERKMGQPIWSPYYTIARQVRWGFIIGILLAVFALLMMMLGQC